MNHIDLQQLLERELKGLPTPKAPASLLPRVLIATAQKGPAESYGGWLGWPRGWQVASAAALVALAAVAWMLRRSLCRLICSGGRRPPPRRGSPSDAHRGETATLVRVSGRFCSNRSHLRLVLADHSRSPAPFSGRRRRLALGGATQTMKNTSASQRSSRPCLRSPQRAGAQARNGRRGRLPPAAPVGVEQRGARRQDDDMRESGTAGRSCALADYTVQRAMRCGKRRRFWRPRSRGRVTTTSRGARGGTSGSTAVMADRCGRRGTATIEQGAAIRETSLWSVGR